MQWLGLSDGLYIATQPLHFALIINQDLLSHLANIDLIFIFSQSVLPSHVNIAAFIPNKVNSFLLTFQL